MYIVSKVFSRSYHTERSSQAMDAEQWRCPYICFRVPHKQRLIMDQFPLKAGNWSGPVFWLPLAGYLLPTVVLGSKKTHWLSSTFGNAIWTFQKWLKKTTRDIGASQDYNKKHFEFIKRVAGFMNAKPNDKQYITLSTFYLHFPNPLQA